MDDSRKIETDHAGAQINHTACTAAGTPIPLWRLRPVARPTDPRWQGRAIRNETVVQAPTAAMARLIAARLDRRPDAVRKGNETLCFRSGFEDEKLYWVHRADEAETASLRRPGSAPTDSCAVLRSDGDDR